MEVSAAATALGPKPSQASHRACVFLEFLDFYDLFDASVGHRTEVYSLMRESTLPDKDYLDTFYDTGQERSQK